jgi:hypothetical protein
MQEACVSVVYRALEVDCTVAGGGDGSSNDDGHPLNHQGCICFVFNSFLGQSFIFCLWLPACVAILVFKHKETRIIILY